MRTFKLPKGWPSLLVNLSESEITVLLNGKTIILPRTCIGDPRTLRGEFPGVQGWIEICKYSRMSQSGSETFLYIRVEQIAREFNYERRITFLEIPLSAEGGYLGHFREMHKLYWPLRLKLNSFVSATMTFFSGLHPWCFASY